MNVPARVRHASAALRVRNYRLYWIGQVISRVGTWMQQVSLPWLVLALGGSPIELGIVAALEFLPAMLLAPFGGVYADRLDKRKALLVTHSLASAQVIVLFVLTVTGVISIPLIMALSFALGLVNAIDMPLRQALAAELVPRNVLTNAIALNSMAFNAARVVGPAVAGVTIAIGTRLFHTASAGVAFNLAINAVSFSAVLLSLWWMDPAQIRRPPQPERPVPVLESLREGVAYSLRSPIVLWALVLLGIISTFGLNFRILLPLFTQHVLQLDADAYGALYAAMGLGSLGGAIALAFMHERRALALMVGGGLLFGVLELTLSFTRAVLPAVPLLLGIGFFSMLMINTINATVQANVPDVLRGRVMALYVTVFAGSSPIGGMFAGVAAENWGVPTTFMAGALISLAAVALVWWRWRVARGAGRLGRTRLGTGDRYEDRPERQEPSFSG
ncbi:MAG TPA: MFS transporter [Candidatus Limnocylindria bacterium]|nr:MFS transporter [Candidatus Limnocylindria bacterium]